MVFAWYLHGICMVFAWELHAYASPMQVRETASTSRYRNPTEISRRFEVSTVPTSEKIGGSDQWLVRAEYTSKPALLSCSALTNH